MDTSSNRGEDERDGAKEKAEASRALSKRLQQATISIIRASSALPKIGEGFELYSTYPIYAKCTRDQRVRITIAMKKLLANSGCKTKLPVNGPEDMEKIIFANDILVERAAMALDEHQKRVTQGYVAKKQLTCEAEVLPGATTTATPSTATQRSSVPSLCDAMQSVRGFKDGRGRYAQLGRIPVVEKEESAGPTEALEAEPASEKIQPVQEFNADGYKDLLHPGTRFNNRQLAALTKLWKWRWITAQKHSKSVGYVLPDHMMLRLAEVLPRDMQGIIAVCHPLPPFVQHDLPLLHRMIASARELRLEESGSIDQQTPLAAPRNASAAKTPQSDREGNTPQLSIDKQLERIAEMRFAGINDPQPGCQFTLADALVKSKSAASIVVLDQCPESEERQRASKLKRIRSSIAQWTTPYESYLLAKKMRREEDVVEEVGEEAGCDPTP